MGQGHYGKTKMQVSVTGASGFIGGRGCIIPFHSQP
jgi:hypothetical protein